MPDYYGMKRCRFCEHADAGLVAWSWMEGGVVQTLRACRAQPVSAPWVTADYLCDLFASAGLLPESAVDLEVAGCAG